MVNEEEMIVTPWEVRGKIDYEKLIREFGTQPLTDELMERMKKDFGDLHLQLRRRLFFSHRDFDLILDRFEKGQGFVLYTGRGPSGPVHIGHLVPWIFTKYLQEKFHTNLYFQMTDDEKFVIEDEMALDETTRWGYENALDLIALGFKPENTNIIFDVKDIGHLYDLALKVAKKVTYSTAKAVFGFQDSTNIGWIFWPAIQAVPCFIHAKLTGENVPVLIPAAIDQDPYWRITRDVAQKLGYHKPAQIHCRFVPGLGKGGKMSASEPETCIFTTDTPEQVKRKIWNAFTGGKPTVKEQRKTGGDPYICTVFQYFLYLFEEDDEKIAQLDEDCRTGGVVCGDCKALLTERVNRFLKDHQKKREDARKDVQKFYLKA
ncbi:MAG: tryptophan--tRNA ligase [Candidatus Bathyarchaeia archaeon]|jgi:tryptophanyl-tRNA synthetase|nr:tryptophan--tRNA ligase [Candidatus Bathyarchaeota archaeon A05DMB-4]MDH7595346.1 tryptophan--tRNA ligase [Candidatus Bathyarchaeota archaeon]